MSVLCEVILDGGGNRHLAFNFEPRLGDTVFLPGVEEMGKVWRVERVIHRAKDPHDSRLPTVAFFLTQTDQSPA